MVPGQKEDYVVVLDFLPNGYPFDNRPMHRKTAIAQAISKERFTLLELVPKKGVSLQPQQAVYIGEGKREDVHHVQGRIQGDKLTQTARLEMEHVVKQVVEEDQDRFVQFFNKAGPISTRRHQIELLPGIGKKHMWQIIDERRDKPFESFADVKARVPLIPDPMKAVIKRIVMEINGDDKFRVFVR